jgi:hypothetical protein
MSSKFDQGWKESPAHLDLLSKFGRGRDLAQVMDWQYVREAIGESTKKALDRFQAQGMLIPCTVEESLENQLKVSDIKPLLKERGHKVSGNKMELLKRLVEADPKYAHDVASQRQMVKCSPEAINILENYFERRAEAEARAKQKCFDYLIAKDIPSAYLVYIEYQREFQDQRSSPSDHEAKEIDVAMTACPDSLKSLDQAMLLRLQSTVALKRLWYEVDPYEWLGDIEGQIPVPVEHAISHLNKAIDIKSRYGVEERFVSRVRVTFSPYDLDSCELCKKFDGQILKTDQLPNFPLENCTSKTGCNCEFEYVWDDENFEMKIQLDAEELFQAGLESYRDPTERLKTLKELLDQGLITQEEYDQKRGEILKGI